jgi:tetratricopeptide (TPR) repeat protein
MRALLLLCLFGLFNTLAYAQTSSNIMDIRNVFDEKGDFYFGKKEFEKAIVYYNMAYKHDANNYYSVLRKAESYTALDLYDQAAVCYQILFETKLHIPNEYRLQYALLLLKNKDIKGFEKWMAAYNEIVRSEIHDYLTSTEVRAKMYKDSSMVLVENEYVVNTVESEIAPAIYKDMVIFASTRKNLSGNSGVPFYDLFSASYQEGGQLGKLNRYNKNLNSSQNESSIAFSEKTNSLFITRAVAGSSIMKTFIANIPVTMNDRPDIQEFMLEGFSSIGHVSCNSNGTKIYFISDAQGGIGGLDIYSSELTGGRWSKPKNLGPGINSSKDEKYPFILNDSMLYFSSAGHNSLGGFDLFSVNLNRPSDAPKNLGNKVNSQFDELALSFSPGGLTGYFCSNRPGGFGREDIYRVHLLDIKVKLPAYKFKKKSSIEEGKINLYLSSGEDFNIASGDKSGFDFGFQPGEAYKLVIQHENPVASNIMYNYKLANDQRKKEMLSPLPLQKTEIRLQPGIKYRFTAGMKPISAEYIAELNEMSQEYQNSASTIDLTALAKELLMTEGEIYTVRFVKDENQISEGKDREESDLFINDQTIPITGQSFLILLPLDIQVNFNIQTDLVHFRETFQPKKVGSLKVDAAPVYKQEQVTLTEGFPILVNSESYNEVSQKQESATELSIIPGSMYILTFRKRMLPPMIRE